jgi:hypothetical protein
MELFDGGIGILDENDMAVGVDDRHIDFPFTN